MKKKLKRLLAMALSLIMVFTCFADLSASAAEKEPLEFGSDGKFKILVFADTQDQYPVHAGLINRMKLALEREEPDLVVLTGDQTEINTKDPEVDFKRKRRIKNSDFYFFETYYPIIQFYSSNFDKRIITRLIDMENRAISYYEKKERRYLTNCYFIKAEFYRIVRNWKAAEEFYSRCYDIYCHNGDKDILYLVAITCKCLQYFEQIDLNIPFNWNVAIEECKQREEYMFHNRLISQIELACLDREFCKQWLQRYRITINPIP